MRRAIWLRRLFLGLAWAAALATAFLPLRLPSAGACDYSRSLVTGYQQTYVAPVASYVQTYTAPVYKQVYPQAVKVAVVQDYYSSVSDYARDKLLVDAVAGKTQELMQLQQQLQQLQTTQQQLIQLQQLQQRALTAPPTPGAPGMQGVPGLPPASSDQAPPLPPPSRPGAGAVPQQLSAVVQRSCLRCHGADAADQGGGFDLRDLAGVDRERRLLSYMYVNTGEMPKAAKPLTDDSGGR